LQEREEGRWKEARFESISFIYQKVRFKEERTRPVKMDTSTMIEAKKEYTTQLQQILSPRIYERFKFIFDGTIQVVQKELAMSQVQSGSVMKIFQKQLSSIKDWNESNIIEEYERIKSRSKCNYLDKLIKAVIIANMKILSTIQYGGPRKSKSKIQVHIPTPTHFIHKCYVECAKEIYKNPYIFDMSSSLSSKEKHQNLRDSLLIIDNGISSAIRQLLPIGDLLEQNFNSDVEDDTDDESSVDHHRGNRQKGGSVTSSEESGSEEDMSSEDGSSEDEDEMSEGTGSSEGEDDEDMTIEDGGSEEDGHNSDMSSISSGTASEDEDGGSEEENATLGQKSESSISKRSQVLASRVESYLEDQTADDIQISIGGDKETQSMLANVMEQRAEKAEEPGLGYFGGATPTPTPQSSPVYSPTPAQPQPQSGGGFLGALYTTFASSRNMKPNADDVSVPTVKSNPPPTGPIYGGAAHYQQQKPEEVKQIVFSGATKLPPGFSSMPAEPPKPVITAPPPAVAPTPAPVSAPVPSVNPSYGIYPPRAPTPPQSPVYHQPTKPVAPKPVASTQPHMVRPQMGNKKLSLKEQKYGVKTSSGSASHSIRIDSDDDASFHF
jgi:Family of unknown function (DUF5764)